MCYMTIMPFKIRKLIPIWRIQDGGQKFIISQDVAVYVVQNGVHLVRSQIGKNCGKKYAGGRLKTHSVFNYS